MSDHTFSVIFAAHTHDGHPLALNSGALLNSPEALLNKAKSTGVASSAAGHLFNGAAPSRVTELA